MNTKGKIILYENIMKSISKTVKHLLNESVIETPTVADVICNKLKLPKLQAFVKQDDDAFKTKYIDADYVNNALTKAAQENNWQFIDFYMKDDTYANYAYKCILNNTDPKDVYSRYVYKKTLPIYTEFKQIFDNLHKKIM